MPPLPRQRGIALIVVLVFLLALTAISLYGARQAVFGERIAAMCSMRKWPIKLLKPPCATPKPIWPCRGQEPTERLLPALWHASDCGQCGHAG